MVYNVAITPGALDYRVNIDHVNLRAVPFVMASAKTNPNEQGCFVLMECERWITFQLPKLLKSGELPAGGSKSFARKGEFQD